MRLREWLLASGRARRARLALLVLVPLLALLMVAPAWAFSIGGTIFSGFDSSGIPGVRIDITNLSQTVVYGSATTSVSGTYVVSGLDPGIYMASTVGAAALGYADATSTPLQVLASDVKNNLFLSGGRTLSGRIQNILGQPVAGVTVSVWIQSGNQTNIRWTSTGSDGVFSLASYPRQVKLDVGENTGAMSEPPVPIPGGYVSQWWNGKADKTSADLIDLTQGDARNLVVTLQGTRTIHGRVTDLAGSPLAGVLVGAYFTSQSAARQMTTAADGLYSLIGLPPVMYTLFASDQLGRFQSEWFQDRTSFATADPVNVGSADAAVDFSLTPAPPTTTTLPATTTTTTLPTTTTTTQPTTTTTTQPTASVFTDVGSSNPYYAAIQGMAGLGIISGYDLGGGLKEFRPGSDVLRAQFAKMVDGALGIAVSAGMTSPFTDLGSDVPGTLYPVEYVAAVYANGITQGLTATTFGPFISIPRAQVVTMVVRALQRLHPAKLATPPATYLNTWGVTFSATHGENARIAEFNGLLSGLPLSGTASDPWAPMPRGEVAQVLWNVMRK